MDCGLDYSKAEDLFSKSTGTTGSILEKGRDSFESMLAEEVWLDLSHPIEIGRWGLDGGE